MFKKIQRKKKKWYVYTKNNNKSEEISLWPMCWLVPGAGKQYVAAAMYLQEMGITVSMVAWQQ